MGIRLRGVALTAATGAAAIAAAIGAAALLESPPGGSPDAGFGRVAATVVPPRGASRSLCLLHARTPAQHRRGLMGVTDPALGGCDGIVFTFRDDTRTPFWMRDTPLPLSVAYFDADGVLVSTADMTPCGDHADCPGYPPAGAYRYALEVPRGRLPLLGVVPGARLVLGTKTCDPSPGAR